MKNEQFAEAASNTVDAAYNFLELSLESIEKLTMIQLTSSKKLLNETSQTIKGITGTANSKDLLEKVNLFTSNALENNICNCKDAYEVLSATQSKVSKIFETYFHETQKAASYAVEAITKFSPKETNFAADFFKNSLNGINQAIDIFSKVASQTAELATDSVKAATQATASSVKKSTNDKK